ncbi:MAG: hypothetical protein KDD11_07275 [Acidobacteria bacterium]|nr:hypothetical protein [Acidobacteriota bacterium]
MGLFDLWETRHILWKRDESFSRKGVRPVTRAELPGLDFEAGADVFMPILQTDPATIKVDAFFDRVIAARRFDTKSVFDPRFHQTVATVEWLDLPAPLTEELAALGVVLASYGCAYWSADLMAWNGGLGIIELNTCSVGRKLTWPFAERLYLRGYCSGLKRLVGHSDPCCLGEALERVRRLDEEHRCPCS